MFKNIFNKIFNSEEEDKTPESLHEYGDKLKNSDVDYRFAQLFTLSGGVFNYCADEAEALSVLNKIINAEKISSVFCCDQDLQNFLDVTKTPHTPLLEDGNDAAFITCEYLIAYDGRIMLSYENILHFTPNSLPEKIIIMANVSQIVSGLDKAMYKIKNRENIKNLTSISGGKSHLDDPNRKNPKLFLLLLED